MNRRLLVSFTLVAVLAVTLQGAPAHRARLSDDLLRHEARRTAGRVRVIVHGTRDEVAALAAKYNLDIARWLPDSAVVRASSNQISTLAGDLNVDHLSGDSVVTPTMSISDSAMAADQTRAGTGGLLGIGGIPGVTGQGIGIAVVDSGIAPHAAVAKRVVANVSFVTGDPSTADAFGHGTHVAGIIAGSGAAARTVTNLYAGGVAPNAQLINVRVLGANGAGYTSDVIAGIEWAIANRSRYNIKVINLSIGHAVAEPSATDPLCEVVARAVNAGITVVAAAGNDGRDASGARVLGGVTSPGNSPFALTVGALNTWSTVGRGDDTVADYSSRGPTKFEFIVKPDVVAPGNRIISLEADGSYLESKYPFLHRAGSGNNAYMQLSGTSMATPMVSGAVALLLQGAPGLTPTQIKIALQNGATYLPDAGLVGGGAGSVNVWASRKLTTGGLTSLTGSLVGGLLATPSGLSFLDNGTMAGRVYDGIGIRVLSLLDLPKLLANVGLLKVGDLNVVGTLNPLRLLPPNPLIWGEVAQLTGSQAIVWGTEIYDTRGQAIVWGTWADDDAIVWGTGFDDDAIVWGTTGSEDAIVWGTAGDEDAIVWGTNTLTAPEPK